MPAMLDQAEISSPREIRFFEEDQQQLFGGLVSAQLDGAVPEPEPPLVGPSVETMADKL